MNFLKLSLAFALFCSTSFARQFIPPDVFYPGGTSKNSSERPSHYPLITGDTFRSFCDFIFDETQIPFDPSEVKKGDIIFVGISYLKYFYENIVPHIKDQIILITSNGMGTIHGNYLKYAENPKIYAWFGRNITMKHPKICLIPLGGNWFDLNKVSILTNYLENLSRDLYFREKTIHTYLGLEKITHPSRNEILKYFTTQSYCHSETQPDFVKYMKLMSNSRFIIAPRGANIDCFRTWEALWAGSIPVVESHGIDEVYEDLPVIIVEDLTKVTQEFLDQKFEKLKSREFRLEKLHAQYWLDLIQKVQNQLKEN